SGGWMRPHKQPPAESQSSEPLENIPLTRSLTFQQTNRKQKREGHEDEAQQCRKSAPLIVIEQVIRSDQIYDHGRQCGCIRIQSAGELKDCNAGPDHQDQVSRLPDREPIAQKEIKERRNIVDRRRIEDCGRRSKPVIGLLLPPRVESTTGKSLVEALHLVEVHDHVVCHRHYTTAATLTRDLPDIEEWDDHNCRYNNARNENSLASNRG